MHSNSQDLLDSPLQGDCFIPNLSNFFWNVSLIYHLSIYSVVRSSITILLICMFILILFFVYSSHLFFLIPYIFTYFYYFDYNSFSVMMGSIYFLNRIRFAMKKYDTCLIILKPCSFASKKIFHSLSLGGGVILHQIRPLVNK